MYLRHIPRIVQSYYPQYLWRVKTKEKVVYLTFDDGPTPEITDWVLSQLNEYDAKATFFLIGKNVKSHPEIVHRIIDANHNIGNHSQTHRNGSKTDTKAYLRDFLKGRDTISEYTGYKTSLFRPPYGKLTKAQASKVLKSNDIIMMDILTGDFDEKLTGEKCFRAVAKHAKEGSIILFHDSVKAWPRLKIALPKTLAYLSKKGFRFEALPNSDKADDPLKMPLS